MEGTITLVQESRFELTGDDGAAHLFLLGPHAAAEPSQLVPLAARQARLRVSFRSVDNVIGAVAKTIYLVPPHGGRS